MPRRSVSLIGLLRPQAAIAAAALMTTIVFAQQPHTQAVDPIARGSEPVACTNIEQDTAKIAALGGTASDYWEGKPNNGQPRYVTDILASPGDVFQWDAPVPNSDLYPQNRGKAVKFVAVVCYPTTVDNNRADYALPGGEGVVPKMQRAGQQPLVALTNSCAEFGYQVCPATAPLIGRPLLVYSHGLGGSPLGKGYIDILVEFARQGYIVAAVFHADARFSTIRIEDVNDFIRVAANFDRFVEMEALRPLALSSMIDRLLAHPAFGAVIDRERIGGFGASMGGQAMANLLGAKLTTTLSGRCADTVQDARVKAVVGYVPYMGQTFLPAFCDGQSGAAGVTRPYLAIGGTSDTTAPIGPMRQALGQFKGSNYLVQLQGVPHEFRAEYADDVFTWSNAFLQAFVRQKNRAAESPLTALRRIGSVQGGVSDSLLVAYTEPPVRPNIYWNPQESGHGLSVAKGRDQLFGAWYIYDQNGRPDWVVMTGGQFDLGMTTFTGKIYSPLGSAFDAYQASAFRAGASVGELRMRFPTDPTVECCAVVDYTLNGRTLSVSQATLTPFVSDGPASSPRVKTYEGLWWGGAAQNGWGIWMSEITSNVMFLVWYTYDSAGQRTWYVMSNGQLVGNRVTGDAYKTTGSQVLGVPYNPSAFQAVKVGTFTIDFVNAASATFTFDIEGKRGSYALSRFEF